MWLNKASSWHVLLCVWRLAYLANSSSAAHWVKNKSLQKRLKINFLLTGKNNIELDKKNYLLDWTTHSLLGYGTFNCKSKCEIKICPSFKTRKKEKKNSKKTLLQCWIDIRRYAGMMICVLQHMMGKFALIGITIALPHRKGCNGNCRNANVRKVIIVSFWDGSTTLIQKMCINAHSFYLMQFPIFRCINFADQFF